MTRNKAIEIRSRQLSGGDVTALELDEAVFTLSKRRDRRMVLPELPRPVREHLNALLAFRLGLEIGRTSQA